MENAQDELFLSVLSAALKSVSSEGVVDPEEGARRLLLIMKSHTQCALEADRVASANLLNLSSQELRLLGGEMTSQEVRTVKAVLENRARLITSSDRRK